MSIRLDVELVEQNSDARKVLPEVERLVADLADIVINQLGWNWSSGGGESGSGQGCLRLELTLTLTGDEQIRQLNRQFRSLDEPTDVLSFPVLTDHDLSLLMAGRRPAGEPPDIPLLLGDIVLNMEEAQRAAARYGHSVQREVGFLFVHGLLHLLGFHHDDSEAEARMNMLTENALQRLGLQRAND